MANSRSAEKRFRQSETRRARNRADRSALKSQMRRLTDSLQGPNRDTAATEFKATVKQLDQLAAKGVIHRNAAARKKSRLARRLNKV